MDPTDHSELRPPDSPRDIPWIFLGPRGLRAGWGILLFAGVFAFLFMVASSLFDRWLGPRPSGVLPPGRGLLGEAMLFILVLVATRFMSVVERKHLLSYGFEDRARAVRLVSGLVWGFIAISALILVLWKLGYLSLQPGSLAAGPAFRDAILWGLMFLLTGITEESLFRGYVQFTLARGIGFWWGALLVAAAFSLAHGYNPGESPVGLFSVGAVGLVFCLSLWYTGSLWWAVGFHAAWDWAESYFYGTADSGMIAGGHYLREHPSGPVLWSGGATGPEGSLLIVPLLLVIALLMFLWWGRRTCSPFAGAAWRPMRPSQPVPPPAIDAPPG
ncbi:MAG TPA: CPBP family intramembrane glutamic endopeptidase [Acidobacteriaceae bacterium]|nr:CPBP family intramembrane glutamic endopeptidase [Acidobacteriaceae bacterium]